MSQPVETLLFIRCRSANWKQCCCVSVIYQLMNHFKRFMYSTCQLCVVSFAYQCTNYRRMKYANSSYELFAQLFNSLHIRQRILACFNYFKLQNSTPGEISQLCFHVLKSILRECYIHGIDKAKNHCFLFILVASEAHFTIILNCKVMMIMTMERLY